MKKIIFLVAAIAAIFTGAAQDFKVRVTSGGEAVGYAYILINGSYHAMASAEGTTSIPARKLKAGDTLSASFVGMTGVPFVWDASMPAESTITLELTPNTIESVVVTAAARDRSRQMFRRHVNKVPTHEWFTGFRGDYDITLEGDHDLPWNSAARWRAFGTFERNHIPGEEVNSLGAKTFSLSPDPSSSPIPTWKIQRYILLVRGIAERAVQLGSGESSNRGMVIKYRGVMDGKNVFLIVKPYFDAVQGADESFQTLLHVDPESGIVTSSQTVSRTKWGIWNVSADYVVHRGSSKEDIIGSPLLPGKSTSQGDLGGRLNKGASAPISEDNLANRGEPKPAAQASDSGLIPEDEVKKKYRIAPAQRVEIKGVNSPENPKTQSAVGADDAGRVAHTGVFIYPIRVRGSYVEKTPTAELPSSVDISVTNREVYQIAHETAQQPRIPN